MSDGYLKLTNYFAERLRSGDRFLADALLDLYGESAVATSVVLRGIASFGPHRELRSDQSLSASEDSPIAIAAGRPRRQDRSARRPCRRDDDTRAHHARARASARPARGAGTARHR